MYFQRGLIWEMRWEAHCGFRIFERLEYLDFESALFSSFFEFKSWNKSTLNISATWLNFFNIGVFNFFFIRRVIFKIYHVFEGYLFNFSTNCAMNFNTQSKSHFCTYFLPYFGNQRFCNINTLDGIFQRKVRLQPYTFVLKKTRSATVGKQSSEKCTFSMTCDVYVMYPENRSVAQLSVVHLSRCEIKSEDFAIWAKMSNFNN